MKIEIERAAFEDKFPVPRGVIFDARRNFYESQEPYIWGSDARALKQNTLWLGWTSRAASVEEKAP